MRLPCYWKDSKVYCNNVSLQDVSWRLVHWNQAVYIPLIRQ